MYTAGPQSSSNPWHSSTDMNDALKDLNRIQTRIQKYGCVLMLDFDGTLSPIVDHPADARITPTTRMLIRKAAKKFPVAVISGRPLNEIKRLVGVTGIAYAGEHGHTWQIGLRRFRRAIPRKTSVVFATARQALINAAKPYPSLVRENKGSSIAFNYRSLRQTQARMFRRSASEAVRPYLKRGMVRLIDATKTFEIIADTGWTKGECAKRLYKTLKGGPASKALAVYIGDSRTDEDAFKALSRSITIRVGNSSTSAARYHFKRQRDVTAFINDLIAD